MDVELYGLFDKIFDDQDLTYRYLTSLMGHSDDEDDLQIKLKQVKLLRTYLESRDFDSSCEYLHLLADIEQILDRDKKLFADEGEMEGG